MEPRGKSSGLKNADGIIKAAAGYLLGFTVNNDAGGTNDAVAVLYDNASAASGTVVGKGVCDAVGQSSFSITFPNPIWCENGLYLDVTGTGCEVVVYFI